MLWPNSMVAAGILCGALAAVAPAQQSIRVDVNLVNLAFTARDASGHLVNNLTKDDVEIFEDGTPQKIEFFAKSTDVPLTMALIVDVSGSQDHFGKQHEKDLEIFLEDVAGTERPGIPGLLWEPHTPGNRLYEFGPRDY